MGRASHKGRQSAYRASGLRGPLSFKDIGGYRAEDRINTAKNRSHTFVHLHLCIYIYVRSHKVMWSHGFLHARIAYKNAHGKAL